MKLVPVQWCLHCEESVKHRQCNTVIPNTLRIISCHANILAELCYLTQWVRTHIASSYHEPPLELARLLECEYDRCYPTISYHDLRDQNRRPVCWRFAFVRGKTRDNTISELVNNVGSAISWRTLLLLVVDDPWYTNEVGTDFHLPKLRIWPSLPPAARSAVGDAIRMQWGLNHSGFKPKSFAQLVIAWQTWV